ncbi:uncharacterized protein LAESUDRAFT_729762 [Laetiporus sulphureus 93-53]|uniref:Uncharacterized protein n=1 Tax=Laetiporus sulphureus 93-53 TaxID=1314785 RepID=A0A165CH55_9APHY|nr:uncharacterized protein LAESUDRAFT_729762 [Laetiporus sulphureus 93-53]KZT02801.1 hypothetical protein LAESUDRAFT_729762 [Laetiporus sulphureus 93-53]
MLVCRLAAFFNNLFGGAAETFIVLIFVWSLDVILTFKLFIRFKTVEENLATDEDQGTLTSQAVLIVEEIEMMSV